MTSIGNYVDTNGGTDSLIGSEVDGYLVEAMLGRGGMARVYRGYDVNLNRFVALKVIDPHKHDDVEYNRRFRKEAQAIAQLRHPNIVGVYRFGEVNDMYYMAMDYIDGPDLAAVLRGYRANDELMPHDGVYKVMSEVGKALDYAHKRGIIHRDVKPSNIMINSLSEAILTDFGLALVTAEGTTGDVFGSPFYIAPEQAMSSSSVVPQTDIYSLGVTLYEMLTGFLPFSQGQAMQIVMSHMTDTPPPPQDYNPHLHMAFNAVLEKALDKDPNNRYANCQKLVAALRSAIRTAQEDADATGKLGDGRPNLQASDSSLRLSTARLPDKVRALRQANPLPSTSERKRELQAAAQAPRNISAEQTTNAAVVPRKGIATETQAQPRVRRRSRPGRVLLYLLLLIAVSGAGLFGAWQAGLISIGSSEPVTIQVEGIVRTLDGERITIFDQTFIVNAESLSGVSVGDTVSMRGEYVKESDVIRFTDVQVDVLE